MPTFYQKKSGVTRQQWDPENIEEAAIQLRNQKMSVRAAAKNFNVPRNTLSERIKSDKPGFSTIIHKRVDPYLNCKECTTLSLHKIRTICCVATNARPGSTLLVLYSTMRVSTAGEKLSKNGGRRTINFDDFFNIDVTFRNLFQCVFVYISIN